MATCTDPSWMFPPPVADSSGTHPADSISIAFLVTSQVQGAVMPVDGCVSCWLLLRALMLVRRWVIRVVKEGEAWNRRAFAVLTSGVLARFPLARSPFLLPAPPPLLFVATMKAWCAVQQRHAHQQSVHMLRRRRPTSWCVRNASRPGWDRHICSHFRRGRILLWRRVVLPVERRRYVGAFQVACMATLDSTPFPLALEWVGWSPRLRLLLLPCPPSPCAAFTHLSFSHCTAS
jgi:hypothetical protein